MMMVMMMTMIIIMMVSQRHSPSRESICGYWTDQVWLRCVKPNTVVMRKMEIG